MGGPGSGRKKGSGKGKKKSGIVKIKLNPNKKVGYTISDIGAGGKVVYVKKGYI